MEDENADRVYVPGTNGSPPDRDVEPFWPPEELSPPVHGGKPVPHDASPAFPLPPVTAPTPHPGVPAPHQAGPGIPAAQHGIPAAQHGAPAAQHGISAAHPATQHGAPAAHAAAQHGIAAHAAAQHGGPAAQQGGPGPAAPQQGDAGLYRPVDRATAPAPTYQPPGPQFGAADPAVAAARVPVQPPSRDSSGRPWAHSTAESAAPVSGGSPASGDGPDPSLFRGASAPAGSVNEAGAGSGTEESSAVQPHTADSPWAQPPQRPTTAGTPVTSASAPAPGPAATSVPSTAGSGTAGSGTAATPSSGAVVTPASGKAAEPVSGGAEPNSTGAVYRPGPVTPGPRQAPTAQPTPNPAVPPQPGPHQPTPPAPHQAGPHQSTPPGPHQAGPHQSTPPGPHQAGPHQSTPPGPHQAGPHQAGSQQAAPVQPGPPAAWVANGRPVPPVPGPYPPAVAPPNQGQQPGPNPPPVDPYQQLPWVSDGTPTAEEFARRRLAKPAEPVATMGARAMLQKGTMGLVRLAPGKREQEYKQDVEMVRRNFGGLRQVTVVNPKGGAGKTVAVLLLAMTFGQKRGGYVLAWDNNETQGTLGMRAQQDFHARTVRDMMRDLHLFRGSHGRVGDLSQYVRAQGEGMFDVLASDESATAGEMLTASAFAEIREIVSRFYKLIFVDTGNNVRAQNWQAAMDATDQLVITMSARNDSAETAARMLDHLEQSGRQRLVRQAVSVVTMPPTRKDIDLPAIQRHFAARTRAVLLAPYEKLIDSGEPLRYGHLSNGTRDSWLKIAAAVAEGL
ncbi:hypothetical protein Asp14428_45900 [Actinoplanes sp. NBRC 14428]|nr:hypothetical protein Asp14428_45900 [Actinoplanes sp. NBRC 14428]